MTDQSDPTNPLAGLSPEDAAIVDVVSEGAPAKTLTDADVVDMTSLGMDIGTPTDDSVVAETGVTKPEVKSPAEDAVTPVRPTEAKKTYQVGRRTFETADELAAYVSGLEQNQLDLLDKLNPITEIAPKDPEIGEVWFENPQKAAELIEKRIEEKLAARERMKQAEVDQAIAHQKSWEAFYKENPDLVGFEDTVQAQLQAQLAESGDMPTAKGLPLVAKRARDRIAVMRKRLLPTEELLSAPAATSGTTGAHVAPAKAEPQVESFANQVKSLRRGAVN